MLISTCYNTPTIKNKGKDMKRKILEIFSIVFTFSLLLNSCGSIDEPRPFPEKPPEKPMPEPRPVPEPEDPEMPEDPEVNYCVDRDMDFNAKKGRFKTRLKRSGRIQITEPVLNESCVMIPATFCNGTGGRLGMFQGHANLLASHGYIVSSYETTNSGSGKQAVEALMYVMKRNNVTEDLALVQGMSQGGQCAASTTYELERRNPEILVAGIHMVPAYGMSRSDWRMILPRIKSPAFVFNGSRDRTVSKSWVKSGWDLLRMDQKYWYTAVGAGHIDSVRWAAEGGTSLSFANMVFYDSDRARDHFFSLTDSRYWEAVYQ